MQTMPRDDLGWNCVLRTDLGKDYDGCLEHPAVVGHLTYMYDNLCVMSCLYLDVTFFHRCYWNNSCGGVL